MKVKLKFSWFAPDATLYGPGVHDFNEEWYDVLPKTASVVKEELAPVPVVKEAKSLKDFDTERANSDEYSRIMNKGKK